MSDGQMFATLKRARRVWAVGAIHADAERLARLHDGLARDFRQGDRLVYLGNMIGHGRPVIETIDELLYFRRLLLARSGVMACDLAYLRGSQEEMWDKLLQLHLAVNPAEVLRWMFEHGIAPGLEAYGSSGETALARARAGASQLARWTNEIRAAMQANPGHVELFSALRRAAYTEDGGLLFVHAGINRDEPLTAQGDALWWGGNDFDQAQDAPYGDFTRVVRGFDPRREGYRITEFGATLDGGCGFGGKLIAACFSPGGRLLDRIEA
ncbi:MAG: hypothetical protein V3V17_07870 [Alphaproteobacteria bacterium]